MKERFSVAQQTPSRPLTRPTSPASGGGDIDHRLLQKRDKFCRGQDEVASALEAPASESECIVHHYSLASASSWYVSLRGPLPGNGAAALNLHPQRRRQLTEFATVLLGKVLLFLGVGLQIVEFQGREGTVLQ